MIFVFLVAKNCVCNGSEKANAVTSVLETSNEGHGVGV